MFGDPETCRKHAKACLEKANKAQDESTYDVWFEMAQQWVRLASGHESVNPFLALLEKLEKEWKGES